VEGTGKEDRVSVERVINCEAGEIFALIADAGKHPSFDGSGTVRHAPQDSIPLSPGSKFGMAMRWGLPYRTWGHLPLAGDNTVIEFEQDRLIAWQTTVGHLQRQAASLAENKRNGQADRTGHAQNARSHY
jgi:hypothetical protein